MKDYDVDLYRRPSSSSGGRVMRKLNPEDKPYVCEECGTRFVTQGNLNQHRIIHTGVKPFACNYCPARFFQKGNLKTHIRRIHRQQSSHPGDRHDQTAHRLQQQQQQQAMISSAPIVNTVPAVYSATVATSSQQISYQPIPSMQSTTHLSVATAVSADGEVSTPAPSTSRSLITNSLSANSGGRKEYTCDYCNAVFTKSIHLYWHKQKHQSGSINQRYQCPKCPASFDRKYNFKIHMRTHTGEKPYKCNECGAAFSQPNVLKSHMLIHTDNKEYKCTHCTASFSKPFFLKSHMLVHRDASYPLQMAPATATNPVEHMRAQQSGLSYNRAASSPTTMTQTSTDAFKAPPPPPLVKSPVILPGAALPMTSLHSSGTVMVYAANHSQVNQDGRRPSSAFVSAEPEARQRKPLGTRERKFKCHLCVANFTVRRMLEQHLEAHSLTTTTTSNNGSISYCVSPSLLPTDEDVTASPAVSIHDDITPIPTSSASLPNSRSSSSGSSSSSLESQQVSAAGGEIRPQTASAIRWNHLKANKIHKCRYCYMRFSAGHHLRMHMLTHTGEKPFRCAMCTSRFTQSGSLYRHQRNTGHYGVAPVSGSGPPITTSDFMIRQQPLRPNILPYQPPPAAQFLMMGIAPAQPVAMVMPQGYDRPIDLSIKSKHSPVSAASAVVSPPSHHLCMDDEEPCDLSISKCHQLSPALSPADLSSESDDVIHTVNPTSPPPSSPSTAPSMSAVDSPRAADSASSSGRRTVSAAVQTDDVDWISHLAESRPLTAAAAAHPDSLSDKLVGGESSSASLDVGGRRFQHRGLTSIIEQLRRGGSSYPTSPPASPSSRSSSASSRTGSAKTVKRVESIEQHIARILSKYQLRPQVMSANPKLH